MAGKYIFEENSFRTATLNLFQPGTVTVEQDAYIQTSSGDAFDLSGNGWTFKTDGTIEGAASGIVFLADLAGPPAKSSKLTVGAEGTVIGENANGYGVFAGYALDVTNSGEIEGGSVGLNIQGTQPSISKSCTIINNASASIGGLDFGIRQADVDLGLVVKNSGTIEGATAIAWAGALTLTNSGKISGDVGALDPNATFSASITNSGELTKSLSLANGNDTVKNTGIIGDVNSGDYIKFFDGKNSLTNGGFIRTDVFFGAGDDTATNSGEVVGTLDMGHGANKMTNSGKGDITDDVKFGSAADTFVNGGMVGGNVTMSFGDDKLTNSGSIVGLVQLGADDDVLANTGLIDSAVDLGSGHNKVTNSGDIVGNVESSGSGENAITNSGTIRAVILGGGDDVFNNTGKVTFDIKLGAGNDKFTGGKFDDQVTDDLGDDVVKLGGGNDTLHFTGQGTDFFDGGAGMDALNGDLLVVGYWLNLDSKAVNYAGPTIAAGSLAPILGIGGTAIVKGFESAALGKGNDLIFGGAAAEQLNGNAGNDTIYGGGGSDRLSGGLDDDTFAYVSTKDSGNTLATRDQISGFEGAGVAGGDTIDLSAIDANTKMANDQSFAWLGPDKAFTAAGQLRSVTVDGNTIIQGEVNGDGKVDFSIALVGSQALVGTDFEL